VSETVNNCPACADKRVHSEGEWGRFHPFRGHGYTKETGWTHPELEAAVEKARSEQVKKLSEAKQ
jgi:hypothetical protein